MRRAPRATALLAGLLSLATGSGALAAEGDADDTTDGNDANGGNSGLVSIPSTTSVESAALWAGAAVIRLPRVVRRTRRRFGGWVATVTWFTGLVAATVWLTRSGRSTLPAAPLS